MGTDLRGCGGGGVRYGLSGKRGRLRFGATPAHGGLSLRPQGRARFENFRTEIFGGRSSEAAGLKVCRNGCAEMQYGGASGRFLLAALHSVAKRVRRRPAYHPRGLSPFARETVPHASAATIRSSAPSCRAIALCPRGWKRSQDSVFWFLRSPAAVRSSPSSGKWGHPTLASTRGPCGAGGRAFRGLTRSATEWSAARRKPRRAAAMHLSAAISADVKARRLPTSDRRKFPSAEIFEARATLREQSGSTLGRRGRHPNLSPYLMSRALRGPRLLSPRELPNRADQPSHLHGLGEMLLESLVERLSRILAAA